MAKVGTIDKLMSFLPGSMFGGLGGMSKSQKEAMQGNLDRYRTIMDSMTAWEKNEPAKIKAERIQRIARGSGVKEKDVRELIAQWKRSRKMMKGMGGNRKLNKQMRKDDERWRHGYGSFCLRHVSLVIYVSIIIHVVPSRDKPLLC